jgi:hypothetical protein
MPSIRSSPLLRSYGAIGECDLDLPKTARVGAILRRLLRGLYAVRAPIPPFSVPAPLLLVATIGELRDVGRKLRNCIAQNGSFGSNYWFSLADGSVVYLASEEPPLLIALRRVAPDLWHIEQIGGPKDAPPSVALQRSIEQKLKDAGARLVSVNPSYALSNLDRAANRSKPNDADDLEDALDDFDD